jgi:hypothetical protein
MYYIIQLSLPASLYLNVYSIKTFHRTIRNFGNLDPQVTKLTLALDIAITKPDGNDRYRYFTTIFNLLYLGHISFLEGSIIDIREILKHRMSSISVEIT